MQNAPEPIEFAPVCCPDRIEQVVEKNHRNAGHGDKRGWQKNQPGQNNHRAADGPDDLAHRDVVINIQEPTETNYRDLQQDKPKATAQKEPGKLPLALASSAIQKGARACQENERWRTEMGDPAG